MILAILQARMSSTRLPGKVLMPILGKPMIQLEIERVLRSRRINKVVVATSTAAEDGEIENLCNRIDVACFRGDLKDVLDRYYRAASQHKPEHVVRLTGDCPVMDPTLIDRMIDFYFAGNYEYVCNTAKPTFPDGLDIWVFRFSILEQAWREAKLPSEREHVVPYMKSHPELFRIGSYEESPDLSQLRWTVDEPQDFELIRNIYEELYSRNPGFTTAEILQLIRQNPNLKTCNTQFERDAGYKKSLLEDRKILKK